MPLHMPQWFDFVRIYEDCMKRMTKVFLLEPLPMKDDGFRSLDVKWQHETYDLMAKLHKESIIIPSYTSVEQRVSLIEHYIYHG